MFFSWLQRRRRRRLLATPFPDAWRGWLEQNVRHWRMLPEAWRPRLERTVRILVAEKHWSPPRGGEVTEEMRVTIAAQAAVMTLGLDEDYYFDDVRTIVVHPGRNVPAARDARQEFDTDDDNELMGQAWHRGPIVLAWQHVLRCGRNQSDGMNLVVHEFAHHLDGLEGDIDGQPPLPQRDLKLRWYRVAEAEYLRLVGRAQRGEVTLLDHYGAESLVEFFAVASECFFERPRAMRERHTELYDLLVAFYRQSPAEWLEDHAAAPAQGERRVRRARRAPPIDDHPEAWFVAAVAAIDDGDNAEALRWLDRVLRRDPRDVEALVLRAAALFQLGDLDNALDDCCLALELDPENLDALRQRAAIELEIDQVPQAIADLEMVVRHEPNDHEAHFRLGRTAYEQGDDRRAIEALTRVLDHDPLDAEANYYRGQAYHRQGNAQRAEYDLERARHLDPELERRLSRPD